jgi:anti-anti-sigma factor
MPGNARPPRAHGRTGAVCGSVQVIVETHEETGRGWDGHLLLLHGSEDERVSGLVSWVRQGLANNEKVIWAQAPADLRERSGAAALSSHGIDVDGLLAAGRLAELPLAEFYQAGGHLPVVERALAEGYRAARITCEVAAALTILAWPAYLDREREVGELCRSRPLSALCQYQQAAMSGSRLREITGIHLDGIRRGLLATRPEQGGLALAGEVDVSNETILAYVLQAATARAGNTLRLELSGLRFLSVAGCRILDETTRQYRDHGGRVLLIAPSPPVARILRLTRLNRLRNVEVVTHS